MKPIQNADGGCQLSAREYPIDAATAVKTGAVVKMSAGRVVPVTAGDVGRILGIAAENHPGTADALNSRADGDRLLVYDAPGLIFESRAPVITCAAGGGGTTIIAGDLAVFADDDFNGGYLSLIAKGDVSANTDAIGTVRSITDFVASTKTFTVTAGGTPAAGDKYAVYPPIGFAKGNYGDDRLVLSATSAIGVKIVGGNTDIGTVRLMAKLHELGVEE